MTITQAIQKAYLEATGKATPPAAGTNKYNRLLGLADNLTRTWAAEEGIDWSSRYELVELGTITATDVFDLDDSIRKLSMQQGDYVTIANDDQTWLYTIVDATRFRRSSGNSEWYVWGTTSSIVARIGRTLKFPVAFTSTSPQIGATLTVPAYTYVDDIDSTTVTEDVQVDDPMWLVYMMAAEYVRNDTVKQGQYANLVAKAADRMNVMKRDNGSQLDEIPTFMDSYGSGETW